VGFRVTRLEIVAYGKFSETSIQFVVLGRPPAAVVHPLMIALPKKMIHIVDCGSLERFLSKKIINPGILPSGFA